MNREYLVELLQRSFPNVPLHLVERSIDESGYSGQEAFEHLTQMLAFARPFRGLAEFDMTRGLSLHGWTQDEYNQLVAKLQKKFPIIPARTILYALDRVICDYKSAKSLLHVWMVEYEELGSNPLLFTAKQSEPLPAQDVNDEDFLRFMQTLFPANSFPTDLLNACIAKAGTDRGRATEEVLDIIHHASNYRSLGIFLEYGIHRGNLHGHKSARYDIVMAGLQKQFPEIPMNTIKYVFDDRSGNVTNAMTILGQWIKEFEDMPNNNDLFRINRNDHLEALAVIDERNLLINKPFRSIEFSNFYFRIIRRWIK